MPIHRSRFHGSPANARLAVAGFVLWSALLGAGSPAQDRDPATAPPETDTVALIREVAQIVAENFFDPQLRGLDWAAIGKEYERRAAEAVTPRARAALINEMLARLDTSHTRYFDAGTTEYYQLLDVFAWSFGDWLRERFAPDGVVRYPGIGWVTRERDGRHFVIGMIDGTPASRSAIAVGDAIVAVDGQPFRPIESFAARVGQTVEVTVQRTPSPNSLRAVKVTVERLAPREMYAKAIRTSARATRREGLTIAYVRMWSYAGQRYQEELETVLGEATLREARALVLDLRDGWGGASPRYLNLFNPRVPVLQSRRREGEWVTYDTQWRKPVVLLINEGTRSGKEILAHGFRTAGIGPVVGTRTAGSVTAGRLFRLSNDDVLYVAVSDIRVDGVRLEGQGVAPDVEVPFEVEFSGGIDPQLQRAYEIAVERARAHDTPPPAPTEPRVAP